jgi:hypothetical protein
MIEWTVPFLFGGMIFLLAYTRLGGLPTVALAGVILVGYLLIEAWHAWRDERQARRDSAIGYARLDELRRSDTRRYIAWAFTPWPEGSASPRHPTEFSDVHNYRNADRWVRYPVADAHRKASVK